MKIIPFLCLALLTGCGSFATLNSNTPHTTIKWGSFQLENPKDTVIGSLTFEVSTNGTMSASIQNLSTVMKAENIAATGEAQSKIVEATGNVTHQTFQDVSALMGQVAATAAKTAVK